LSPSKLKAPTPSITFGPSVVSTNLLCPLLTSDTPSHRLTTVVAQGQSIRSPRVIRTHLHAYIRRIYDRAFRTSIGLWRYLPPHPARPPRMRFLFIGPALCLQLPSDPTSRWAPLPRLAVPVITARRGLSPPRCMTCLAHREGPQVLPWGPSGSVASSVLLGSENGLHRRGSIQSKPSVASGRRA